MWDLSASILNGTFFFSDSCSLLGLQESVLRNFEEKREMVLPQDFWLYLCDFKTSYNQRVQWSCSCINVLLLSTKSHEDYIETNLVILNRSQRTRTTPELAPLPNLRTTPTGGRSTHYVRFSEQNTRRIFSGIGFRIWSPPAPRPYHPSMSSEQRLKENAPKAYLYTLRRLQFH
ncbi:hypothetical protein AVEN_255244-1 [Araneus ventricosus]|uniref:Uncharacterized protein n=1 Tax=Araneus ventricosus TaxID=182803 RepID=A0A4Y2BA67_ARAVE|nr:hypothetical protein AVEN_255244-1 [Araneus ventricosus]